MPKEHNFEFELLKCNKAPPPFSFCPKPLADVEVFSNVSLLVLSWESSTHFLENPKK